ncbi:MAG: cysteine desulfurase family protein [Christensenellaceae bacterium]
MKALYFDHAASTPLDPIVFETMRPYFTQIFANPSSSHFLGRQAMEGVDEARDSLARLLQVKAKEIYFTSGGTEADNWAIKGVMRANEGKGKHLIVSSVEHPAVLESAKYLQREGFDVDYLPVTGEGFVDPDEVKRRLRKDTVLVAVMAANNEVGTIQSIGEIARLAHENGTLVFSDGVQAAEYLPFLRDADLVSYSAHKIYGPKGAGMLFVRDGVRIERLHHGGRQQRSMRGGTIPTPLIVGFAEAFRLAQERREESLRRVAALKERFLSGVASLNGVRNGGDPSLPGIVNVRFPGKNAQALLGALDQRGVCASTGSACTSGAVHPSHVLVAMGMSEADASSSIRFSFGKDNTFEEIDTLLDLLSTPI